MKKRKKRKIKKKNNVLVVLGYSPKKTGKPSNFLISRTQKAIEIYKHNKHDLIILSGGVTTAKISEAEIMRTILQIKIPTKKIILEDKSKSTIENALFCWEILKDVHPKKVTVVTSKFHAKRVSYIFNVLYAYMNTQMKVIGIEDAKGLTYLKLNFKEFIAINELKIKRLLNIPW